MSYSSVLAEHRRLSILRELSGAPGYRCNTSLLQEQLERYGLMASRDQIEGDCAWLEEQSLVSREAVGRVCVITLIPRGQDVATGRAMCPGVKRPSPADLLTAAAQNAKDMLG